MFCIYCQGNKTSTTSPKTKLLHLGEQRFTREKKNLLVFSRYSWILALPCGEQLLWCIETLTSTFYFAELCHVLFGSSSAVLCISLDCCIHADCSGASQLRTNSKIGAKVKNIKLENKHDSMIILVKGKCTKCYCLQQHRLGSGHKSAQWYKSTSWFSRFLFCLLCKKIFLAVKYVGHSFLGNTSERQGEILTTVYMIFLQIS